MLLTISSLFIGFWGLVDHLNSPTWPTFSCNPGDYFPYLSFQEKLQMPNLCWSASVEHYHSLCIPHHQLLFRLLLNEHAALSLPTMESEKATNNFVVTSPLPTADMSSLANYLAYSILGEGNENSSSVGKAAMTTCLLHASAYCSHDKLIGNLRSSTTRMKIRKLLRFQSLLLLYYLWLKSRAYQPRTKKRACNQCRCHGEMLFDTKNRSHA